MRRASREFGLIEEGDCIAVGLSGGKDSTLLLYAMAVLQRTLPCDFSLRAVSLDLGWGNDYSEMAAFCDRLGVPLEIIPSEIGPLIFEERKEKNPCSMCAKMRRGALGNLLRERGISKLALGHHFDDAVETFMMSLLFEGRLSCFQPVTYLDRSGVTQIRPLIYAGEQRISNLAHQLELPIVENPCPQDKGSKRYEIKQLLKTLGHDYPDMRSKIFGAMQRLPLDGWAPER